MRILFPAAEVAPFSKTGGLADVAGALPKALARLGHEVLVVTPWYAKLGGGVPPYWVGDVASPFDRGFEPVGVGVLEDDVPGTGSVRYAFVGHQDFRRAKPYGYPDDARRFARFSRAVPSVAERLAFAPDLVHAHDWHTGYLPMILARGWHLPPGFPGLRSVFTVHNVQYQGESGLEDAVRWLRLGPDLMGSYLDHFGRANAMQAGVGFATRVTTVSPTYAEEIQTPEYGYSLDGTFRSLSGKLTGILNGIDTDVWDPARDPTLPEPYSAADLAGKSAAKRELTRRFGLDARRPLLAVVSRLAEQKGMDLLIAAAPRLLEQGWSLVVLGAGDPGLEEGVSDLARARGGLVGAHIGYAEDLAHLVYAGADALAVPSRFEPCGLSQLIAMRYGTVPIVRATGGLKDTVRHGATGFVFEHGTSAGLEWAAGEALAAYGTPAWRRIQATGMAADRSWQASAAAYSALYESVLRSWV
ncbi:MAG: glycogen synthase [Trueperaceae bacterium]|nr:glycogen synthase [Trueperaceae bacterium]MCC6311392.1 glycogen synthase [Trueperaceae bacterium]MCO5174252.1 glycogen synthase [Trueperaceae bacterium]MCW5820408.1 glycogen synthase [Trueperaceae bacterium]